MIAQPWVVPVIVLSILGALAGVAGLVIWLVCICRTERPGQQRILYRGSPPPGAPAPPASPPANAPPQPANSPPPPDAARP